MQDIQPKTNRLTYKLHSKINEEIEKKTAETLRTACHAMRFTADTTRSQMKKYAKKHGKIGDAFKFMPSRRRNDSQQLFYDVAIECPDSNGCFLVDRLPLYDKSGKLTGESEKWVSRSVVLWDLSSLNNADVIANIPLPHPLPQEKVTAQHKPRDVDYVFWIVHLKNEQHTVYLSPETELGIHLCFLICFLECILEK